MPQQKSLVARIIVLVLAIFVSAILLLPNLATRKLQIAFQNYQHTSDSLPAISKEQIQDFLQDPDNGLPFFFPGKKCVILKINGNDGNAGGDSPPDWNPQDDIALATQAKPTELQERSKSDNPLGQTRCILEDRFLSSAKINTLIQAFPNLIEEKNTVLLPHFAERMISELLGRPKQLAIKLGLDLQGGMRVILRADFESYRTRIEEKIAALRKDSQTAKAIDKALTPETQKTKIVDPIDFSNLDRIETSKETPNSEEIQTRIDNLEICALFR